MKNKTALLIVEILALIAAIEFVARVSRKAYAIWKRRRSSIGGNFQ